MRQVRWFLSWLRCDAASAALFSVWVPSVYAFVDIPRLLKRPSTLLCSRGTSVCPLFCTLMYPAHAPSGDVSLCLYACVSSRALAVWWTTATCSVAWRAFHDAGANDLYLHLAAGCAGRRTTRILLPFTIAVMSTNPWLTLRAAWTGLCASVLWAGENAGGTLYRTRICWRG